MFNKTVSSQIVISMVIFVFVNGHSLNTSPEPSGMPMLKGTERGEVFGQHLPNT